MQAETVVSDMHETQNSALCPVGSKDGRWWAGIMCREIKGRAMVPRIEVSSNPLSRHEQVLL